MDPRTAATRVPDPDAVEFIRFCYRRRRVGWPELYDEMCAVAAAGCSAASGRRISRRTAIGFSLFDMPALAAMASEIVAEEQALRRPVTVVITPHGAGRSTISSQPWPTGLAEHRRARRTTRPVRRGARRGVTGTAHLLVQSNPAGIGGVSSTAQARMRRLAISPSIWRSAST